MRHLSVTLRSSYRLDSELSYLASKKTAARPSKVFPEIADFLPDLFAGSVYLYLAYSQGRESSQRQTSPGAASAFEIIQGTCRLRRADPTGVSDLAMAHQWKSRPPRDLSPACSFTQRLRPESRVARPPT